MKGCNHHTVTCKECGAEGSPAQLLAQRTRTRSPAAQEQSRNAAKVKKKTAEIKKPPE